MFCLSKLTSQPGLSNVGNFPRFPSVSLALACRPAMNELIKVDRKLCCLVGSAGSSADPSADYPKYWKKNVYGNFQPGLRRCVPVSVMCSRKKKSFDRKLGRFSFPRRAFHIFDRLFTWFHCAVPFELCYINGIQNMQALIDLQINVSCYE